MMLRLATAGDDAPSQAHYFLQRCYNGAAAYRRMIASEING